MLKVPETKCRLGMTMRSIFAAAVQARKHLSAGLRQRAERAELRLVELDPNRPIAEQGAFATILHKATGDTREGMAWHHAADSAAAMLQHDLLLCLSQRGWQMDH